jgi:hypothetical protein
VNEELLASLRAALPEIRSAAASHSGFEIRVPDGQSLSGTVALYLVKDIEDSFMVSENLLDTVCDLETIEEWRD